MGKSREKPFTKFIRKLFDKREKRREQTRPCWIISFFTNCFYVLVSIVFGLWIFRHISTRVLYTNQNQPVPSSMLHWIIFPKWNKQIIYWWFIFLFTFHVLLSLLLLVLVVYLNLCMLFVFFASRIRKTNFKFILNDKANISWMISKEIQEQELFNSLTDCAAWCAFPNSPPLPTTYGWKWREYEKQNIEKMRWYIIWWNVHQIVGEALDVPSSRGKWTIGQNVFSMCVESSCTLGLLYSFSDSVVLWMVKRGYTIINKGYLREGTRWW